MSADATFDASIPSLKDWARQQLGDTPENGLTGEVNDLDGDPCYLIADVTYFAYFRHAAPTEALAQLAESLITRFGQEPDKVTTLANKMEWTGRLAAWENISKMARSGNLVAPNALFQAHGSGIPKKTYKTPCTFRTD